MSEPPVHISFIPLRAWLTQWESSGDLTDWSEVLRELRALIDVGVDDETLAAETGLSIAELRRVTGRDPA